MNLWEWMMSTERLEAEKAAFRRMGFDDTMLVWNINPPRDCSHLLVAARTALGLYTLRVDIGDNYPYRMPYITVLSPLTDYRGVSLCQPISSMHTLDSRHGGVSICYANTYKWRPNNTLARCVLKCMIWLNAYELHLRSHLPIDYYLRDEPYRNT